MGSRTTALWALVFVGGGCGTKATSNLVCEPTCPAGTRCTDVGCVADSGPLDLALMGQDLAGTCGFACSGATPYCNDSQQCVPCLVDAHCPPGELCTHAGSITLCAPGCSDDSRCAGLPGTPRCCHGRCTDTSTDVLHCGACDAPCGTAHASSGCTEGVCSAGACEAGWGDCNVSAVDGCEVNLAVDGRNCGACGKACALPHAIAACAGTCYLAACNFGYDDCNGDAGDGCEVSVLADIKNCGRCGNGCTKPPHAAVACVNAACQLTRCDQGFADCDGNPANGCEVSVGIDVANCGACGNVCGQGLVCTNGGCTCKQCAFANARSACVNNVCQLSSCLPGFGDCDNNAVNGCETDLTADGNNCGACGNVCGVNLYCNAGVCGPNPCPNPMWLPANQAWTQNNLMYASEILNNYFPTNLLDGDFTTRWVTQSNANQWIMFNLGKVATLSSVRIVNQANYTANAGGKDTILQVGPGIGGPWTDVTMFTVANQQNSYQEFKLPQTQSQYWRFYVLNNWGYQSYIQFMEIGFSGCL